MFDDVWKNIAPGEERTFSDESVIGYRIGKEGESYWFGLKGNFNPDELISVENSLEHLRLSFEKTDDNKNYLKINLGIVYDEQYLRFFNSVCFEICKSTMHFSSNHVTEAAENIILVFNKWINLFKQALSSEISENKQKGLFGELFFITQLIKNNESDNIDYIINSWIGPGNPPGEQDFKFRENLIEIKAQSSGNSSYIKINSQNQISFSPPQPTFLVCQIIEKSKDDESSGQSILDLKNLIEKNIKDLNTSHKFLQSLISYGYNEEKNFINTKWKTLVSEYFHIGYDFPVINQTDLPNGIVKVQYDIIKNHNSVQKHSMEEESFFDNLFNKKPDDEVIQKKIEEYVEAEENQFLEKKRTWIFDFKRFKEKDEAEKNENITFKIIKTIAGFMNTRGGCLIIGVKDSMDIVENEDVIGGVEQEIELLFNNSEDNFIKKINEKILSLIGESFINLYTLRVHQIRQKKILVIRVMQSKKKVFIRALSGNNRANKLFFVRKDNFTIELHGLEIDEHWNTR